MLRTLLASVAIITSITAADPIHTVIPNVVESFPLTAVRLLDSPFTVAMAADQRYLLSLEIDRLLHTFRLNAGLPSTAAPLGGWEKPNCELRGHFVGHYLSACAQMYAATGDVRFKERVDTLVTGLVEVQQALAKTASSPGYLSAFPESLIERYEAVKSVWAPWYTLHKLHAGLIDAYTLCGNQPAKDAAIRFAAWTAARQLRLTPEQRQKALDRNEVGGISESLANLAAITGNSSELQAAQSFDHQAIFSPLATGISSKLDGKHANTQIPKIIAAAREYELTGDAVYRTIVETFWTSVAIDRAFVIGGHSDKEHFFPITDFAKHLSVETCETCNSYNMLKLTRHLFAWQPDARYMDFYERTLYNHILASQNPTTSMMMYLVPMKSGHFKTYSTPLDSFWCCMGTGVENHATYANAIYGHQSDALWVNLFIPSQLTWSERQVTITQNTPFPDQGRSTITVQTASPQTFRMRIRHPSWAGDGWTIAVNGATVPDHSQPGQYAEIARSWRDGDRVDLILPMTLHSEALPGNPKTIAFCTGPIVLAGEFGSGHLPAGFTFEAHGQLDHKNMVPESSPALLAASPAAAVAALQPGKQPLTWSSHELGKPTDLSLIPFFRLHNQRYAIYWTLPDQVSAPTP